MKSATNASIYQGELEKDLSMCHTGLVSSPLYLHCLHVSYDTPTCNLYVYKPVANRRLFFDGQVLTLLLVEYTLFAHANLYYPTTRQSSYFSTIFAAHLRVYSCTMGCKKSLTIIN